MTTEIDLTTQVTTISEQASHLLVKDKESFDVASKYLVDLSSMIKVVKKHYKPLKEVAQKAHKFIKQQETDDLAPLEEADQLIRGLTGAYALKEQEKQQKAQEKADEKAQEIADREAKKLRDKAEKEEDPDKKAELEDQADNTYAKPKLVEPVVDKTSKVDGGGSVTFRDDIEVEITAPLELLEEIISGRVPQTVYEIKPAKLKAWVKANAIKQGQVPGIRIKNIQVQSVRGA